MDDMESFLILKYGSLEEAFRSWLGNPWNDFTYEQHQLLVTYGMDNHPTLEIKLGPRDGR